MPMSLSTRRTKNRQNEAPRGLTMQFAVKLTAAGVAKCLLSAWLLVLLVGSHALAMDRAELGKVIKSIPPNGPFWKYGTVIMRVKSKKAGLPPVVFAHWSHRARYTCRVCHLELGFSMRAGDTGITRYQYLNGKYCGACHNGVVAFTAADRSSASSVAETATAAAAAAAGNAVGAGTTEPSSITKLGTPLALEAPATFTQAW